MAFISKAQIEQAKKNIEAQLKALEQEEKDFEAKAEGFKLIHAEKEKYNQAVSKIAEKFKITAEELKAVDGPKALIYFEYDAIVSGVVSRKGYEWYMGKIGKAPLEFETEKTKGAENMKTHLTEEGKAWIATDKGKKQFEYFMMTKTQKEAVTAADKKAVYFM